MTSAPAPTSAPATDTAPTVAELQLVQIEPWLDPVIDTVGHDPRSAYVERFWLGVLGPSTVLLFRRLALAFDHQPEGFALDLLETAAALGLTGKDRRDGGISPVIKALHRSCNFGVAKAGPAEIFVVRKRFPPLTRRQLEHLHPSLRHEHRQWVERDARRPVAAEMRHRARRLALSLVEIGESYDDAERQLHRWKFHPAVAHDAVRWAHSENLARRMADHERAVDAGPAVDPPIDLGSGAPTFTRLTIASEADGAA